jgi:hypothetical protein
VVMFFMMNFRFRFDAQIRAVFMNLTWSKAEIRICIASDRPTTVGVRDFQASGALSFFKQHPRSSR